MLSALRPAAATVVIVATVNRNLVLITHNVYRKLLAIKYGLRLAHCSAHLANKYLCVLVDYQQYYTTLFDKVFTVAAQCQLANKEVEIE